VAYYPATRTRDGWVWIEQFSLVGWVSTSVVDFEHVTAPPPLPPPQITPYLNHVAVWHWRGDSVSENTIDELAQNLKRNASHVTQVWVKSSDYTTTAGAQWMGYWDSKRSLAIDGPASIDRWVETLAKYGLVLHLWMGPRGADIDSEARLV